MRKHPTLHVPSQLAMGLSSLPCVNTTEISRLALKLLSVTLQKKEGPKDLEFHFSYKQMFRICSLLGDMVTRVMIKQLEFRFLISHLTE